MNYSVSKPNTTRVSFSDASAFLLGCVLIQLPFYQLYVSLTIAAWILLSLIAALAEKHKFNWSKELLIPISFYLLYAIGILWSDNKQEAYFEMELKMSMILFPLVMMYLSYGLKQIKIILYTFLIGCILSAFYHIGLGVKHTIEMQDLHQLFYVYLSPIIHPSYQSFYMNIMIMVLLYDYMFRKIGLFQKNWVYLLSMALLFIFSFMLLSKNGIMTAGVLMIVLMVHWWRKGKQLLVIGVVGFTVVASIGAYNTSEYVKGRTDELFAGFGKNATKKYLYSTSIRRVVWREGFELYTRAPWFGYGTGDVQDKLNTRYNAHVICQALERTLNVHNQFLQTALTVGILGFLILFMLVAYPIRYFRRHHYYFGTFCLMSILFFSTESVLQTQAGVVGFMAFYVIFNNLSQFFEKDEIAHSDAVLSA